KKSFGEHLVLNGVDLDICQGDRIGLVGRNGTGKTTLANILTGCLDYDEGTIITARRQINIGYLRQAAEPELYLNLLDTDVNGEFRRVTSHLGMNRAPDWPEERRQNLSGGERTKLALAAVWASRPDLVILDEPTNHMDYQGRNYLVSELAGYKGAVVIISHDRYFLDRTVSQIAEIEKGTVKLYQGNYSAYREAKQKERESQRHAYAAQQNEQRKIKAAIAQLKAWSEQAHRESRRKAAGAMGGKEYFRKKAKKRDQAVKSQIKRLEKKRQTGIERPAEELPVTFNLNARETGARHLLAADSIRKTYGELLLFKDSSFYINRGEKVGILGPNGCGKTTLIKTILGRESLDAGKLFLSRAAKIAYVSQELPRDEKRNLIALIKELPRDEQKRTFELLIKLGLPYDRFRAVLGNLSRGERMKIAIGQAIMGEYDLLILDEPTNHLDLDSRESLEESLIRFTGSILIISHDRYLLERVCDHLLIFDRQKITRFEGNPADYLSKKHTVNDEERLLLETKLSRIISELSMYKPGDPDYAILDREYQELMKIISGNKQTNRH
ncbi:MAG: ABC-F family ATP-binding cassette domain-containing protein, partial [Heliobacteriaceae bacterium]|nr:ABC-F family ATP-binding cassette domain-containing protein [Heliobacteriaceae bacterium]